MYDEENWRYIGRNGIINLTYKENKILNYLLENKNRVVKYQELIDLFDSEIQKATYSSITRLINRLRQKLKDEINIRTRTSLGFYVK